MNRLYDSSKSVGLMCQCGKYIEGKVQPDRETVVKCEDCKLVYQWSSMGQRWYKESL